MADTGFDSVPFLAQELSLAPVHISAVIDMLGEGSTVPFIARYRKERTGDLDEVQIRAIQERHLYLVELEDRRATILDSIQQQGKLSDELKARILACATKATLEDLYLPYKPKRRTRATIAKEKGLEPLADRILAQPEDADVEAESQAFVDAEKGVKSAAEALAGARDIIAELMAEDADNRQLVRDAFAKHGVVVSLVLPDKDKERTKYEQYYDYREAVTTIPSHRLLAVRRGAREEILRYTVELDETQVMGDLLRRSGIRTASPFAPELDAAVREGYKRLLAPSIETDVKVELKMRADESAVDVFADNLRSLLLAAPMGERPVVGVDPGLRTGCKCVAIDDTGKFLANTTIYLTHGDKAQDKAQTEFVSFVKRYDPLAIAVGNGTGGRETEAFVRKILAEAGQRDILVVSVNEAGASVYSASDLSREEFPDLDVTVRGSISIARRLQDPLAELVKIDPKSIGVGQYQHDVYQPLLARKLDEVVESCVNGVGVELNTASAPLLARVAGIGPSLSKKIVKHREDNGLFASRLALRDVSGVGPRAFEQAAGFIRVHRSSNALDASAVHPERYALVERMAADLHVAVPELVGNESLVAQIKLEDYIDGDVGLPTLRDIVSELRKPGRDPRASFEPPRFRDDVNKLEDLKQGMWLEGVVTNVTAFGAFVDVGVHQDGLVHVSELADRFVRDPREVVKAGDRLEVRVLEVDLQRRRISLSARKQADATAKPNPEKAPYSDKAPNSDKTRAQTQRPKGKAQPADPKPKAFSNNPFAAALRDVSLDR